LNALLLVMLSTCCSCHILLLCLPYHLLVLLPLLFSLLAEAAQQHGVLSCGGVPQVPVVPASRAQV
jgi:hypothetical protein